MPDHPTHPTHPSYGIIVPKTEELDPHSAYVGNVGSLAEAIDIARQRLDGSLDLSARAHAYAKYRMGFPQSEVITYDHKGYDEFLQYRANYMFTVCLALCDAYGAEAMIKERAQAAVSSPPKNEEDSNND